MSVCVCVCVCVREREKERDNERQRDGEFRGMSVIKVTSKRRKEGVRWGRVREN